MIDPRNIHTIVFDFDGVFTDNKVYVSQQGEESVRCSRADGYAVDLLRKAHKHELLKADFFVLSTEKNLVVSKRCEKMRITCYTGIDSKLAFLNDWLQNNRANYRNPLSGVVYFGNDLNDYSVMKNVGFSIAPVDAHPKIREIATFTLNSKGGEDFVREGVELLLGIQNMSDGDFDEFISFG